MEKLTLYENLAAVLVREVNVNIKEMKETYGLADDWWYSDLAFYNFI